MHTKEDVKDAVYDGLRVVLKKEIITIGDDETFGNYGVDSLDQMGMLLEVEKRLKVDLGEVDLSKFTTINLLYRFIEEKY